MCAADEQSIDWAPARCLGCIQGGQDCQSQRPAAARVAQLLHPHGAAGLSCIQQYQLYLINLCRLMRCLPMLDVHPVQATQLLLAGNALSGPAFPTSWLQPEALQGLEYLHLSHNPGLVGSLPASLPWPRLIEL